MIQLNTKEEKTYTYETELLRKGAYITNNTSHPETAPIYLTTAFNVEDLDELYERYAEKGFCYNRNRNPNRSALAELMTYTEKGEDSVICSSGMAAISTTILALTKAGDHIVSDRTLYGEAIDIFHEIMSKYQVEVTFCDFTNLDEIRSAVRENTTLFYTETVSNPMISVPDLEEVSCIAHEQGALFIVDNTFMTSVGITPLTHGADIVVNSLTKFANGHSDAVCGAVTGKAELIKKMYHYQVQLGCTADAFTSWMVQRGMRTMQLRVEKQMENAAKLAAALEQNPYVKKVFHPSLESHAQHELAIKEFGDASHCGGMLSIYLDDDAEKLNAFIRSLNLAHYAMTLGGYRTTIAHPVSSSHYDTPEEERRKMGITHGMIRISTGIENAEDLIADFTDALEHVYGK